MTAHQHRRPGTIPRTLVPPDRSTVSMRLPGFGTPARLQWRRCCASGWRPTSRRPKRSWRRSAGGSARRRIGAAAAAHGTPGDRPNAVPAVSRCRTRQHHGRAVTLAPGTPAAGECHSDRGRNAAHRRSAASPWLSSARERASTPSAQSLPLILVHCESRRMASVARSGDPDRAAARNQLDQTPVREDQLPVVVLGGPLGRGQRLLVVTEAVVEHCVRPLGDRYLDSFAAQSYVLDDGFDKGGCLDFAAAPRGQAHGGVRLEHAPRRFRRNLCFFDQ